MARLVAAEIVVPRELDPASKQELVDQLYAVHVRIFDGVDKEHFAAYVVDSHAEYTRIQIYRGEQGEIVGYFATHIFEREIGSQTVAILRGETGILREYRGGNLTSGFLAEAILHYKLRHPGRTLYYLGSLVHPSSYTLFRTYLDEVWPREGAETPADIAAFMGEMGDAFGLAVVDEAKPLVRKVGWRTIDRKSDREYWRKSDRPGVQFFLAANPGHADGHGLLTLARLTLGAFVRGLARYIGAMAIKRVKQLRHGAAGLLPAPMEVEETAPASVG